MIKLLIHREVFEAAYLQNDARAKDAIEHAMSDEATLPWAMGDVIQRLAVAGAAKEVLNKITAGVSLIPLNARLSDEALEEGGNFEEALYQVAGKHFKAQSLLNLKGEPLGRLAAMSPDSFLNQEVTAPTRVDFMNLTYAMHPIFNQVDGWHMEIIQNTAFAGGNHVNEFEKSFAEFSGTKFAVGCGSGTEALLFALMAMGVGEGDEVITQPNTFIATTEAISQCGATIVFADVLEGTYNLDPAEVQKKVTSKTKAILPVHLYGQTADMDALQAIADKHKLLILEDACQAHGAEYKGKRAGSMGSCGAFSLYPGKNLGAYGEAGVITTNSEELAKKMKVIREHGQAAKYYHDMEGYNGRMDNIQAASVRAKVPYMNAWNDKRRQAAKWYFDALADIKGITIPQIAEGCEPVWHLFVILVDQPNDLHEHLKSKNIFSGFHYPMPLHLQKAYAGMNLGKGSFPVTEKAASSLLSLPMFPELTKAEVEKVASEIKAFFA